MFGKWNSYLDDEILVVARREELVDEEWPGHQDEEQGVPKLGLKKAWVKYR